MPRPRTGRPIWATRHCRRSFEHKLLAVEKSAEVHDKGVEAVKDALGVTEPAHEKGVEAVRDALGVPQSQGRALGSDP